MVLPPIDLLLTSSHKADSPENWGEVKRPGNISATIQHWAKRWGIEFEYIQPGKSQQNAYVERFNCTVRYEWLSQHCWADLEEVQIHATQWMWKYSHERPNMALGGITPKQRLAMAA